jgi:multicomponent Na+:H+ antiporter subunit C
MNVILAMAVAMLVGSGAYLLLKHDLIRVVAGMLLISYGANLFVMTAGLTRGVAPIYPLPDARRVADPLVQAMTLTSVVITFGVSALLFSLIYRVYAAHATLDTETLAETEEQEELAEERAVSAEDSEEDAAVLAREDDGP